MPKVSVIVLTSQKGKEYLKVCLPSLKRQTFEDFEIIVIDNASTDRTILFLKKHYPEVRVIENKKNMGFSRAINMGILASRGKYIVLLNNDTEVDKNWLKELVGVLDTRRDVYFCASKMLNYYNRRIIDSAGDGWSWEHLGGYNIGRDEKDSPKFSKPRYIFSACGGAAIYRKELFGKIGLFDERLFAYFEDVDLAFRAQLAGFRCLYVPTAIVYHVWGGTWGISRYREFLISRNQLIVILKNFPLGLILKHKRKLFRVFFGPFKAFLGNPKTFYPAVLARLQVFLWLPWIMRERTRIQRQRKIPKRQRLVQRLNTYFYEWVIDTAACYELKPKDPGKFVRFCWKIYRTRGPIYSLRKAIRYTLLFPFGLVYLAFAGKVPAKMRRDIKRRAKLLAKGVPTSLGAKSKGEVERLEKTLV